MMLSSTASRLSLTSIVAFIILILQHGAADISATSSPQLTHQQQQRRRINSHSYNRHLLTANPNAGKNNFCGTSWGDASENCMERQHCPNASDEECGNPAHVCFADTMCDATAGHGSGMYLPPYNDRANVRFCQNQWDAMSGCSIDLYCGDESECANGMICFYSDECHLHDVVKKMEADEAYALAMQQKALVASLDPNDTIRYNSCGKSWNDANANCGGWCWGDDEKECPPGEGCFGDTGCYNDAGLVPTPFPTTYPPTTRTPTVREDPSNYRFCGKAWDTTPCSLEAHCPTGLECVDGEICYTKQRCNVQDLTVPPTSSPSVSPTIPHDHESYYKYCGKSREHAAKICSLRTTCASNDDCISGAYCFGGLPERCNAFYLQFPNLRPTMRPTGPTESPTPFPSVRPTTRTPTRKDDPINTRFCGTAWDRVRCVQENHCPWGNECTNGQICFTVYLCNIHDITPSPTRKPTPEPIVTPRTARPTGPSQSPTLSPSTSPTTRTPTVRDDPINMRFCGNSWNTVTCTIETHCPTGLECKNGQTCFTQPQCNFHDLTHSPTGNPILPRTPAPTTGRPVGPSKAPTLMPTAIPTTRAPTTRDDPINRRFCGSSWNTVTCSIENYCPTRNECTGGQICFSEHHGCNIQDMITNPISADPSLPQDDTSHFKFCGSDFSDAVEQCSLDTHCASEDDCPAGAFCFDNLPGHCNANHLEFSDMSRPTKIVEGTTVTAPRPPSSIRTFRPTLKPSISNAAAVNDGNAQLAVPNRTFRPTRKPSEAYKNEPVFLMPQRTFRPTRKPTAVVNNETPKSVEEEQLVQPMLSAWCGKDQFDANSNCGYNFFWCTEGECPSGYECFMVEDNLCKISASPEKVTIESGTAAGEIMIISSRTQRPSPRPIEVTKRPTNIPAVKAATPRPTTNKPSSRPVMNTPAKQTILTFATDRPTRQPTPKPIRNSPTNSAAPKPNMTSLGKHPPTPNPIPVNIQGAQSSNTPSPVLQAPTEMSAPSEPVPTNKRPNRENPKKPSSPQSSAKNNNAINGKENANASLNLQSTAKDNATGEENVDEKPIDVVTGLDATVGTNTPNARRKLFCLSQPSNFEEECTRGMECSEGNPCPSSHFCLQFDCKNRPPSNGSLDLCPFRFVGTHTKDCKSYYECDDHGYVGPTYTCEEGFKFDKLSGYCIVDFLVNSQCHFEQVSSVQSDGLSTDESESTASSLTTATPPSKTPSTIITSSSRPIITTTTTTPSTIIASSRPITTTATISSHSFTPRTSSTTDSPSKTGSPPPSKFMWWETPPTSPPNSPPNSPQTSKEKKYDLTVWYTNGHSRPSNSYLYYFMLFVGVII